MACDHNFDIAIVGGGACGLAVLLQLLDKASAGTRIAVIEKNKLAGPGLAYSESCVGTHINMHTHTMSIYSSDPDHFTRWMQDNPCQFSGRTDFPSRPHYGRYLNSLALGASKIANKRGIVLDFVHSEVIDLWQSSSRWMISLPNLTRISSSSAVLALGNSTSVIHKHLRGKPLYFDRPWPNHKLLSIPKNASVCILGSRLTAIDEALYLVAQGHTGPITLASRSGQLPKVQSNGKRYERTFALYNLARELEQSPEGPSIITVIKRLHDEIRYGFTPRRSSSSPTSPSLDDGEDDTAIRFRRDVEDARKGHVPGQDVLRATAPIIERYWNCLDEQSKRAFLREYMSEWVIHRHAMPLHTAEKLLQLLESRQLRLARVEESKSFLWNDSTRAFAIPLASNKTLFVDAFVEATGIEYTAAKVESPLMQRLLARGILKPHFAGGVHVDFQTLEAAKNLYVIGSMTRGVHFYSTAIDRNVAHAERLADSILRLPPRKPLHVALFVGTDSVSQIAVGQLVPRLMVNGHVPFIYFSTFEDKSTGSESDESEHCMPFEKQGAKHGLYIQDLSELDSRGFAAALVSNHIDLGLSFLPDGSLSQTCIEFFRSRKDLWRVRQGSILKLHESVSGDIVFSGPKDDAMGYSCVVEEMNTNLGPGSISARLLLSQRPEITSTCSDGLSHVNSGEVEGLIEEISRTKEQLPRRSKLRKFAKLALRSGRMSCLGLEHLQFSHEGR